MRRTAIGAVVVGAVLVLTACSGQGEVASPSPTVSAPTTSPPATPDLDQFTPPPSGAVNEDTGETVTPELVPEWDDASRAAVLVTAKDTMAAFARPELDYETWWAELEPLLTPDAAQDYAYVDPANVPARSVTGGAAVVDDTSAYVARVEVPTDVGTYVLVMSRSDGAAPWLTERITPPEGTN